MYNKTQLDSTQAPRRGSYIRTPWSSQVAVKEAILSVIVSGHVYYGVEAETEDSLGFDWPNTTCLLWVYYDGYSFRLGEDIQHRPSNFEYDACPEIEEIIGHHVIDGKVYFGVRWAEYRPPTWELESKLDSCQNILTDYYSSVITSC